MHASGRRRATPRVGVLVRPKPAGTMSERLQSAVAALGYDARLVHLDDRRELDVDLLLAYGNAAWFGSRLASLASGRRAARPSVVVWHSEPLPPPRVSGLPAPRLHLRELAKIVVRDRRATDPYTNLRALRTLHSRGLLDRIVVTSQSAVETLAENEIDASAVPIGRRLDHGRDLGIDRDIDVLFLGALDVPRRRRAIRALRARRVAVHAVGGWSDPRYWGSERDRLVNRARIFLNVSRFPGQYSGERLVIGMANRALVLSEPMYRPEPFVPGTHFVEADLDDWPTTVGRYLEDEQARRRVADAGHAFVTRELTYERSVAKVLELSGV
jgi:hypothetical protein